jgi:hypothetical protein
MGLVKMFESQGGEMMTKDPSTRCADSCSQNRGNSLTVGKTKFGLN